MLINPSLKNSAYNLIAMNTFEMAEEFFSSLLPLVADPLATVQQGQIAGMVFLAQMRGANVTVAGLTGELGLPRSTVQYSVDKLIDREILEAISDPSDNRRKLLKIPTHRAQDAGTIESLIMDFRLRWHVKLQKLLEDS